MNNDFFSKIKFTFKKQKVVVITGSSRKNTFNAISQVLRSRLKIGEDVLIFETEDKKISNYEFFLKNSKESVLIVTNTVDIPSDSDFFAGERELIRNTRNTVKALPENVNLVLNFDDETSREVGDSTKLKILTFGLQSRSKLRASNFKINGGTNFKINYKGNTIPIWLEKTFGKEQIYSALAACCVGVIFDLNLVEVSEALKNYQPLPGRMSLIRGIKNSWILDDSESASAFSMIEAAFFLDSSKITSPSSLPASTPSRCSLSIRFCTFCPIGDFSVIINPYFMDPARISAKTKAKTANPSMIAAGAIEIPNTSGLFLDTWIAEAHALP